MLTLISCLLLLWALVTCVSMLVISRPLLQDYRGRSVEFQKGETQSPPSAVILCVRGADPTLAACLDGLLSQDHPDMEIHIVLDCATDPAGDTVREAIRRSGVDNVKVHVLKSPDMRRGLKVSAILQALDFIPERIRAIAFLDADTQPHAEWLSDLVGPLREPGTGATSGVRWFDPVTRNPGSLIRAKWNLYAVSLMRFFNIAWGGSFAIRRDVLEQSGLLDRWATTLCEDTCVGDTLAKAGYQVRLVPEVSMVNNEATTIAGCLRFISRQLVFTRLHSRNWLPILLLGLSVSAVSLAVPVYLCLCMLLSNATASVVALFATVVLVVGFKRFENQLSLLTSFRKDNFENSPNATNRIGLTNIQAAFGNYLCQMACVSVSGIAFLIAACTRRVEWRGIVYQVRRSNVTLVKYTPFVPIAEAETSLRGISI